MKPVYIFSVHLEDGTFIAEYISYESPPQVGKTIRINDKDMPKKFEVLSVNSKPIGRHEMIELKVKPVDT